MKPSHQLSAALLLCVFHGSSSVIAAEPGTLRVLAGADSCTLTSGEVCDVVVAGIARSETQMHTGMLLGVKTVDSHPTDVPGMLVAVSGSRAEFGSTRLGNFALFSGPGFIEVAGELTAEDSKAEWTVTEWGEFEIKLAGQQFRGRSADPQAIVIALEPASTQDDPLRHEVGHWLGLYYSPRGSDLDFSLLVAAPAIEGYPEIAGNFRETAEGETGGRVHGHLDFIKQVGDPAGIGPNSPSTVRFEGEGMATFQFDDGTEVVSAVKVETDSNSRETKFEAPALGLRLLFPYRMLPCLDRCRDGIFHGPDT